MQIRITENEKVDLNEARRWLNGKRMTCDHSESRWDRAAIDECLRAVSFMEMFANEIGMIFSNEKLSPDETEAIMIKDALSRARHCRHLTEQITKTCF